jgi:ribosomal protein S18
MASRQLLARALLARGGNLAPAQQQLLRPIRCFSKNRDNDFNNKNDDVQYQYTRAELNMIRDGKTERVMNEELDSLSAKEEVDEDPFASPLAMDTDDVFGLRVTDEQAKTGFASLAPNYKRDRATGKLMMNEEVPDEPSREDLRVLRADASESQDIGDELVEEHWMRSGRDGSGLPARLNELGKLVREENMGIGVLGRSVKAQSLEEYTDDGKLLGRDKDFSQAITKPEMQAFSKFMQDEFDVNVEPTDLPVQQGRIKADYDLPSDDPDDLRLSTRWLNQRAQRQMDESISDDPFADLIPGDLAPTRLVNRKRAKLLPLRVLHHNNIQLIRSFLTPMGQIKSRVQTRLGARDQRRVARVIKRARCLGLIPHLGQVKEEHHGWHHAKDIRIERPWEKQLKLQGLELPNPFRTGQVNAQLNIDLARHTLNEIDEIVAQFENMSPGANSPVELSQGQGGEGSSGNETGGGGGLKLE